MPIHVFLSYRRSDTVTANAVWRVRVDLTERFGKESVFLDNESLTVGAKWKE